MRLRWIAGSALAAALAVTAALSGAEGAAAQSAGNRSISVVATGEASARPDIARLNAGVEAVAPTARQALDDVNTRLTAVIGAIRAAGVAEEDVQTSGISVYRQEKPPVRPVAEPASSSSSGAAQATEIEFRASNTLNILVRDISQVGPLIDTLIANGVNNLFGVQFGVRDEEAMKARALADAVAKARPMAEAAARAAGLTLGEVESIHEGAGFGGVAEDAAFGRGAASIASNTPVEPGQLTMRVQVRVTFRLAP